MQVHLFPEPCKHYFLDGDFKDWENYVLINDRKKVFRNGRQIKLDPRCTLEFPRVCLLPDNYFLLVDAELSSSAMDQSPNAWVINSKGGIETTFYLGAVHRLMATQKHLICSYGDGLLDTDWVYATNGLVVFDDAGNSQFEYYRDTPKEHSLNFLENYAFLPKSEQSIYYFPYGDFFKIVELSLTTFTSTVQLDLSTIPSLRNQKDFWNPKALTKKENDWFFITPDLTNEHSKIFKLDQTGELEQIGTTCFSTYPRGLATGGFFAPYSGGNQRQPWCQVIHF